MNSDQLKQRTKEFALRIMRLVDALPTGPKGRALASQLVRSGTSVAANYRAACRGRSRAEFIAKIGVVEEEADETALWLELIIEDRLLKRDKVQPLLDEANELVAIMAATYKSAQRNNTSNGTRRLAQSAIRNQQSEI
ncbi:MAG: four helix bundle protein [Chthoniobacterales bacterium]